MDLSSLLNATSWEAQVQLPMGVATVGLSVDLSDLFGDNPTKDELRERIDKLSSRCDRLEQMLERRETSLKIRTSNSPAILPAKEGDVDTMASIAEENPSGFDSFIDETSALTKELSCDASVVSFPDRTLGRFTCQHPGCNGAIVAGDYCGEHVLQSGVEPNAGSFDAGRSRFGKTEFSQEPNVGVWTLDENRLDYNPLTAQPDFVDKKSPSATYDEDTYTFVSSLNTDLTHSKSEACTLDYSHFQPTCGEDECTREVNLGEEHCIIHRSDSLSYITSENRDHSTDGNELNTNNFRFNICNIFDCDTPVPGSDDYCSKHALQDSNKKTVLQDLSSALSTTLSDTCLKSGCDRLVLGSDVYCTEHTSTTPKPSADFIPGYSTITDCAQPGCSHKVDVPGHYCREHSY